MRVVPTSNISGLTERLIRVSLTPNESPLNRIHGFRLRCIEPPGHTADQARVMSRYETMDGNWDVRNRYDSLSARV